MSFLKGSEDGSRSREPWEPMKTIYIGHITEVLQMPGEGKTTAPAHDGGDLPFKPPGQAKMDTT